MIQQADRKTDIDSVIWALCNLLSFILKNVKDHWNLGSWKSRRKKKSCIRFTVKIKMFQQLKFLHSSPLESPIGARKQNSEISSIYMRPGTRQTESETGRWKHVEYMGFPEVVSICLTCPHSFTTPRHSVPTFTHKTHHQVLPLLCNLHACWQMLSHSLWWENVSKRILIMIFFLLLCVKAIKK